MHWYAFVKENNADDFARTNLKKFSYETRLSSRRFCEALLDNTVAIDSSAETISEQILDSKWFFISWKHDSTIRAMLRTIDTIHYVFKDVDDIWESLVNRKNIVFHLLILENFGLSDDLYIKMNARGRLLTPFENLKAEIQDKSTKNGWESSRNEIDKFSYKIDGRWTHFLWQNFKKNNSVDAEFHAEETHDDLFGGYAVSIDKFISDRVLSKIAEFNKKAFLNSSVKKPYKPIEISGDGLELIEFLSIDCTSNDGEWHSDSEIKIDKNGFVVVNGNKTKDFWDGKIRCEQKPLRLKIRNICGDETVWEVR